VKLAAAVVTISLALIVPSAAAASGSITGIVTGPAGLPLNHICVSARSTDNRSGRWVETGSDGRYLADSLPAGSYLMFFEDCRATGNYVTKQYPQEVRVTDGTVTTGINAQLENGAYIRGRVVSLKGAPLKDICVWAYPEHGGAPSYSVGTQADGTYVIDRIAAGRYYVDFNTCGMNEEWEQEWWNDAHSILNAAVLDLSSGQEANGIDASLGHAVAIEGRVTEEGSGAPLAGVCVRVFQPGMGWVGDPITTDADGRYAIKQLPNGWYKVYFDVCQGGPWLSEWWEHGHAAGEARYFEVQAGRSNRGVDATLERGAIVTGTVLLSGRRGNGLTGACVRAWKADGGGAVAVTDIFEDGVYKLRVLGPGGDYKISFGRCHDSTRIPNWATQWWDHVDSFAAARTISVVEGQMLTGVDAALETAVSPPAAPLPGAPTAAPRAACIVPRLTGLTIATARRKLTAAHCRLGRLTRVRANARRGTVVGTRARAGRHLPRRSRVAVFVAR
jgi:hypothetical protein